MPQRNQPLSSAYKSALVTGASSGLGQAIARHFLKEGLKVFGTTRDLNRPGLDPEVEWIVFEGSEESFVTDWIRDNHELLNSTDILVNNCGAGIFGDITSLDPGLTGRNLRLLLETPMLLTQTVLESMRKRRGVIVNISSLASQFPLPYMASYTSAKAGLSAFTQSLMLTEKTTGVVLIDFQAGDFRTAFNRNMDRPETLNPREIRTLEQIEKLLESAPGPEKGARDLVRAIHCRKSKVVRSGGFFQTRIAPLGIRLLPRKCLLALIRRYYHLEN